MTRRERLMATIKGEVVDRPAVNFYEIGGFLVDPNDPDEYNIYNSLSWQPLVTLAENHTDIIRMVSPVRAQSHLSWNGSVNVDIRKQFVETKEWEDNNRRYTRLTFKMGKKKLTSLSRRDKNLDTVWTVEYLLKNQDDVKLFLELPDEIFEENIDIANLEKQEMKLSDKGIVMVDTEDPVVRHTETGDIACATFTVDHDAIGPGEDETAQQMPHAAPCTLGMFGQLAPDQQPGPGKQQLI